jgi:hypothetical protein
MGVPGFTRYLQQELDTLFRRVDGGTGVILVVDYSAFRFHVCGLMISARVTHDGSSFYAFSWVRKYIQALERSGVGKICYVHDSVEPTEQGFRRKLGVQRRRAAEKAVLSTEFAQAPAGSPFSTIWPGMIDAVDDAVLMVAHMSCMMEAIELRGEGEADRLVANAATKLAAQFPDQRVFALTNDSDLFFMFPSVDVVLFQDFHVDVARGNIAFKHLPANALAGKLGLDPVRMPLFAMLCGNDYLPTAELRSLHSRLVKSELQIKGQRGHAAMPQNTKGHKTWECDSGEFCTNRYCVYNHPRARTENFRVMPFFMLVRANCALLKALNELCRSVCHPGTFKAAQTGDKLLAMFTRLQDMYDVQDKARDVQLFAFPGMWAPGVFDMQVKALAKFVQFDSHVVITAEGLVDEARLSDFCFAPGASSKHPGVLLSTLRQYTTTASELACRACSFAQLLEPCTCSWAAVGAPQTACRLVRFATEGPQADLATDPSDRTAVPALQFTLGLALLRFGVVLGTAQPVGVEHCGVVLDQAVFRSDQRLRYVRGRLWPEGGCSPAQQGALHAACASSDDTALLQLWGLGSTAVVVEHALPNAPLHSVWLDLLPSDEWDALDYLSRVDKLKQASAPMKTALLLGMLSDHHEALCSAPASLLLPIAALRWWITQAAAQGDRLSDAEVHAAVSGIVCACEPVLANEQGHGDPSTRTKGTTVIEVRRKVAQDLGWHAGKLDRYVAALSNYEEYSVTASPAHGAKKATVRGRDMQVVHPKPAWMTPLGLRRLQQWSCVLKGVCSLADGLQLGLSGPQRLLDGVDFLYTHWAAMGAGEANAVEAGAADPVRSNIAARCAAATRAGDNGTGAPDSGVSWAGGGAGVVIGKRALRLFDAVLGAVKSGSVASMVDPKCGLSDFSDSGAPAAVPDEWDCSSSDDDDDDGDDDGGGGGGEGSSDGGCEAALADILTAAAELCTHGGVQDDAWWASARLLSAVSPAERAGALRGVDPARVPSVLCGSGGGGDAAGPEVLESALGGTQSEMQARGRRLWAATVELST